MTSYLRRWAVLACVPLCAATALAFSRPDKPGTKLQKNDGPRQRLRFEQQRRGTPPPGQDAGALRREAFRQHQGMVEREGKRFWEQFRTRMQRSQSGPGGVDQYYAYPGSTSQWMPIGPDHSRTNQEFLLWERSGGRVTALAVDPCNATGNTVYAGAASGGVWKTTNGGLSWTPLADFENSLAIGGLAAAPAGGGCANGTVVYAGTGEQSYSIDSYYGAGVLKSEDGGANWTNASNGLPVGSPTERTPTTGGIAIQPGSGGNTVLLAARAETSGIYRTVDGGSSWQIARAATLPIEQQFGATAVTYAPNDPDVAFAGFYGGKIYRSTDGGATFPSDVSPPNVSDPGRVEFAVFSNQVVYAAIAQHNGDQLAGFFRTDDGGASWDDLTANVGNFCQNQCWYDMVVAVHPQNSSIVFVGGSAAADNALQQFLWVRKSINGGTTWFDATGFDPNDAFSRVVHVDQHAMAFTADGSKLYLGNDGGVYSTTATQGSPAPQPVPWSNLNNNLAVKQFYPNFDIHPTDVNKAFGGTQDNDVERLNSTGDSLWDEMGLGCDGSSAVYDQANPNRVFANCQDLFLFTSATGEFNSFTPTGAEMNAADDFGLFIPPLVGDGSSPTSVYFGGKRLWRSTDSGMSWNQLNNSAAFSTIGISAIAVAPSDSNVIYVGTSDGPGGATGQVFKGTTAPTSAFTAISAGLPDEFVTSIAVSPTNPNVAYATVAGFNDGQHVFKLNGTTWSAIDNGTLPNSPANWIAVDPDIAGTLYLATDSGVYISADDGGSWQTMGTSLPRAPVTGLKLHRASRTLRAATHGRGMWDIYVPTGGPQITFNPGSTDFGEHNVGTSVDRVVAVENRSPAPFTINSFTTTATEFIVTGTECPLGSSLAPGSSCRVFVRFTPAQAGNRPGFLVANLAETLPSNRAFLSGMGQVPAPNDQFANAKVIFPTPFVDNLVTTQTMVLDSTDPRPSCGEPFDTRNHSVWYLFNATQPGTLSLDTRGSDYDTIVAAYRVNTPGVVPTAVSEQGCADAPFSGIETQPPLAIAVTAGQQYAVMISGFLPSDSGTLQFLATFSTTNPANGNFSMTATPTGTRQVNAGQSLTYTLTLTPTGGYTGNVSLSCADTTQAVVTCAFNPASVSLAAGAASSTVTVTVTHANSAQRAAASPAASPNVPVSATAMLGVLPFATFKRARRRLLPLLLLAVVLVVFLSSCGGGGGSSGSPSTPPTSNNVASTIVITATGTPATPGGPQIVQKLNLPITVTQ